MAFNGLNSGATCDTLFSCNGFQHHIYIKSRCMNIGRCRRGGERPDFIMADSCVAGAQAPGRRVGVCGPSSTRATKAPLAP
jgi:hypothetical protein